VIKHGDYLTTIGQEETEDYKMLRDLGFEIETIEEMKESLATEKY
jgi:biotin synthase